LATSLAQVQQAAAAGGHHAIGGVTDPRIQVNEKRDLGNFKFLIEQIVL